MVTEHVASDRIRHLAHAEICLRDLRATPEHVRDLWIRHRTWLAAEALDNRNQLISGLCRASRLAQADARRFSLGPNDSLTAQDTPLPAARLMGSQDARQNQNLQRVVKPNQERPIPELWAILCRQCSEKQMGQTQVINWGITNIHLIRVAAAWPLTLSDQGRHQIREKIRSLSQSVPSRTSAAVLMARVYSSQRSYANQAT